MYDAGVEHRVWREIVRSVCYESCSTKCGGAIHRNGAGVVLGQMPYVRWKLTPT